MTPKATVSDLVESLALTYEDASYPDTAYMVIFECLSLAEFLIGKNNSYGDAIRHPKNLLSDLTPREGLLARIDEKLTRLINKQHYIGDDDILDLLGYLVFLRILEQDLVEAERNTQRAVHIPSSTGHLVG